MSRIFFSLIYIREQSIRDNSEILVNAFKMPLSSARNVCFVFHGSRYVSFKCRLNSSYRFVDPFPARYVATSYEIHVSGFDSRLEISSSFS